MSDPFCRKCRQPLDTTPLADEMRTLRVENEKLREAQRLGPVGVLGREVTTLRAQVAWLEADQHCPTCGSSVYTCVDCDVTPLQARAEKAEAQVAAARAECEKTISLSKSRHTNEELAALWQNYATNAADVLWAMDEAAK